MLYTFECHLAPERKVVSFLINQDIRIMWDVAPSCYAQACQLLYYSVNSLLNTQFATSNHDSLLEDNARIIDSR